MAEAPGETVDAQAYPGLILVRSIRMSEITVAIDAMGGDNAPGCVIEGTIAALSESDDINVILCGDSEIIKKGFKEHGFEGSLPDRVSVVHTTEEIGMAEHPTNAIRKKKDSSMVVGLNLVKEGKADAFVSAGNSGAILAGGTLLVGRLKGIERPPLAPIIPTANGVSMVIDCGANMDARPSWLVQFAQMGSVYMKEIIGIDNPRVAIVNVGAEEEKGNALVKETFPLLKETKGINFIGSIEARDIPVGYADVCVCDAFVGNVILKLYEGLASTLISKIKEGLTSTTLSTIGAALAKPALRNTLKDFDATKYGGAPLLGCKGLVVKTHGSARANEIKNTILQCRQFKEYDFTGKLTRGIGLTE